LCVRSSIRDSQEVAAAEQCTHHVGTNTEELFCHKKEGVHNKSQDWFVILFNIILIIGHFSLADLKAKLFECGIEKTSTVAL
jgi:hypothetical protein